MWGITVGYTGWQLLLAPSTNAYLKIRCKQRAPLKGGCGIDGHTTLLGPKLGQGLQGTNRTCLCPIPRGEEGHQVRALLPPEFILFCAQKKYNFNFSLHQGPTLPLVDQVGLGVNVSQGAFYMEAMEGGDAWVSQEAQDSQALLPQPR